MNIKNVLKNHNSLKLYCLFYFKRFKTCSESKSRTLLSVLFTFAFRWRNAQFNPQSVQFVSAGLFFWFIKSLLYNITIPSRIRSRPARMDPPRKNPKFPPNWPMIQVESHCRYSFLFLIMKSGNPISIDFIIIPAKSPTNEGPYSKLYLINSQGGGHFMSVLVNLSECPKECLSYP